MPTSIMLIADMEENVDGIKSTVTDMGYGSSMQETMVETFTTMLDLFTGVLAGIAGISLACFSYYDSGCSIYQCSGAYPRNRCYEGNWCTP